MELRNRKKHSIKHNLKRKKMQLSVWKIKLELGLQMKSQGFALGKLKKGKSILIDKQTRKKFKQDSSERFIFRQKALKEYLQQNSINLRLRKGLNNRKWDYKWRSQQLSSIEKTFPFMDIAKNRWIGRSQPYLFSKKTRKMDKP